MTQTLFLTRGLPASGKSTYAEKMVAKANGAVIRIERDLLRDQLYASRSYTAPDGMSAEDFKQYLSDRENTVTAIQRSMAEAAFKAGKSVIISDTNLRAKYAREWIDFARKHNANFQTIDFDDVSVEECIKRDAGRINSVGEKVIRDMSKFLVKGKIPKLSVPETKSWAIEPYANPNDLPGAVIVDIDGTLAKMADRSPYEWHRVGEDSPVTAVIEAIKAAKRSGDTILVKSGRDGSCKDITRDWLNTHLFGYWDFLYMRAEGDTRKDDLVKYELFNEFVRGKYHVKYVLDDRDQVVKMWRELGLACFQVNYGDF